MSAELPEFYFRTRENGAAVYRVDTENRQRRIELDQIAVVNVKNGKINAHGSHTLTEAEMAVIENWKEARIAELARRDVEDIHRAVDHLNLVAHWVQTRASAEDLEEITDRVLLAMHDLRTVLVRKKAERLSSDKAAE